MMTLAALCWTKQRSFSSKKVGSLGELHTIPGPAGFVVLKNDIERGKIKSTRFDVKILIGEFHRITHE